MDTLIQFSLYSGIATGGLMIILLLLSLLGGLDIDFGGDSDIDTGGGLGILKSVLAFFAVASLSVYVMLLSSVNLWLTFTLAVVAGVLAVIFLSWFLKMLLGLQSNVNWDFHEAEGKNGKVYLKIPTEGTGIIQVDINGVTRDMKAKSKDGIEIPTGAEILILEANEEIAEVVLYNN
jgi:membrane protein implicated in regulation of membrane protease activity